MYRSLTAQSLHYFARPHAGVRRAPIGGPAAWRGEEMRTREDWRVRWSDAQIAELERAIAHARATTKAMGALSKRDFPLPTLSSVIAGWRDEIANGRGFVVLTGLPVERWGEPDSALFFYCFGLHLGIPGAQNPQHDLLGHVRDTGADPRHVRAYRTNTFIRYHCDAADVVGLLCLRAAASGGLSRIVSSVSVYDALLEERPDLVSRLYEPLLLDTHGEGGVDFFPIPPCRYANGRLQTFWHSDYFRSSQDYEGVEPCDARGQELIEVYEAIASSEALYLDMELAPGDVQLISNHTILHGRTGYVDHEDPQHKRHLLRLWLSLPRPRSLRERARAARSGASLVRALVTARARRVLHGRSKRR